MADTGTMKLLVNTPERVFFNGEATFVELATSEDEIGVYPQHIPLTAVLVPCVLTINQKLHCTCIRHIYSPYQDI